MQRVSRRVSRVMDDDTWPRAAPRIGDEIISVNSLVCLFVVSSMCQLRKQWFCKKRKASR